jgi:Protein of unknown function (DUF3617)
MNKWILTLLLMVYPMGSFAALSIKPGLWSIQSVVRSGGQEYDAGKMMKQAMDQMPPEQRKQMEAMMSKMGKGGPAFNLNDKGMQVCFSQEMLKNEEFLNQHKNHDCKSTFPVKTSNHVVAEFKCANGSEGKVDWIVKDPTHYAGRATMSDSSGNKTEVNYQASFVKADCGSVKPIDPKLLKK